MKFQNAVLVLVLFLFCNPANSADWVTYRNEDAGFKVDYPLGYFDQQVTAESGNGIVLKTDDGSAEFRAYAFDNNEGLPMKSVQKIILEDSGGRDITYKRTKNNWIVISGYEWEGDRRLVFYQRLAASKDRKKFSVFEISYPEDIREKFDPLIKRMSLSLSAPTR